MKWNGSQGENEAMNFLQYQNDKAVGK